MHELRSVCVDLGTLRRAVGGGCYRRGTAYAQNRAVRDVTWDPRSADLRGKVRDENGRYYDATAFLTMPNMGGPAMFATGECGCGIGYCRHVVALVLSVQPPEPPKSAPTGPGDGNEPGPAPLAIELKLTSGPRLTARLAQPGQFGGWVGNDLSWGNLDKADRLGDYNRWQVQLLRHLYRIYLEGGGRACYGPERSIDFSAIGSPQLWPVLDRARAAGLPLVYAGAEGVVPACQEGRFHLDVTLQPTGVLQIRPMVMTGDGDTTEPVAFIGPNGQGALCAGPARAESSDAPGPRRFRLVQLARPVPSALQAMALTGQSLEVPVDEFRDRYYPGLRRDADLISSDQSFDLPVISGPELVLHVCTAPGDALEVSWKWAYQVGESLRRTSIEDTTPDEKYRRPTAERRLLVGLDLPLEAYGLGSDADPDGKLPVFAQHARLTGRDKIRFSSEFLSCVRTRHPELIIEFGSMPADQREVRGPLRITVSTDDVIGDHDWFGLDVTMAVAGHEVPFRDVFLALNRGDSRLTLGDGAVISLDCPELDKLKQLLEEACALNDPGPLRISRFQTGLWNELVTLGVPGKQAPAWQKQVQTLLSPRTADRAGPPPELRADLFPHQQDGLAWLSDLWEHQLGGILADEMGLGKTLQCIGLISHARQRDPAGPPFLIVAPTSVRANWVAEAIAVAPHLTVAEVTRTAARRSRDLGEIAAGADAVVTSYGLLVREFAAYAALNWSGLLLDEAQVAKSRKSRFYKCASQLAAPVKIAITGTPLENNLMELWSLLSITAPGLFPSSEGFFDYYARPIEDLEDHGRLAQLRRRIAPWVLRRTKEQVAADLPDKQEEVLEVDLDPPHRHVYDVHLQRERQKVLGLVDNIDVNRSMILRSLNVLRRLSLHAGLIDPAHAELPSAKIDLLVRKLREALGGGHRALVFSQFTGFLARVRARLDAEGLPYCYLDGKTRNRARVIGTFKGGAPIFLISLKAGGTGLNLTEADQCYLLDPWWNPAVEAQAIDRIHRLGQKGDVKVYRLVARDTIEEKVLTLQTRKAQLFAGVMKTDGRAFRGALDTEDILGLLA
jgi:superfamily II DNA or RNA helicase